MTSDLPVSGAEEKLRSLSSSSSTYFSLSIQPAGSFILLTLLDCLYGLPTLEIITYCILKVYSRYFTVSWQALPEKPLYALS